MRKLVNGKYVFVPPPAVPVDPRFEGMTKAKLVAFLKGRGKSVSSSMTKATLLVMVAGMEFPEVAV